MRIVFEVFSEPLHGFCVQGADQVQPVVVELVEVPLGHTSSGTDQAYLGRGVSRLDEAFAAGGQQPLPTILVPLLRAQPSVRSRGRRRHDWPHSWADMCPGYGVSRAHTPIWYTHVPLV